MTFHAEWLRSVCAGCARSSSKASHTPTKRSRKARGSRTSSSMAIVQSAGAAAAARRRLQHPVEVLELPAGEALGHGVLAQRLVRRAGRAEREPHAVALREQRGQRLGQERAGPVHADHQHVQRRRGAARQAGGGAARAGERVERADRRARRAGAWCGARGRSRRRRRRRGRWPGRGASSSSRPQRLHHAARRVRAHDQPLRARAPKRVPSAAGQHAQLASEAAAPARGAGRSSAPRGRGDTRRAPACAARSRRRCAGGRARPRPGRRCGRPPRAAAAASPPRRRARGRGSRRTRRSAPPPSGAPRSSRPRPSRPPRPARPRSSVVIGGSSRPQPRGAWPSKRARIGPPNASASGWRSAPSTSASSQPGGTSTSSSTNATSGARAPRAGRSCGPR